MKLLIVTQRVDAEHDLLGFFLGWIEALARRAERLEVIAQTVGKHDLPRGAGIVVRSLGKEEGLGKLAQVQRLRRYLKDVVRRREVDAVFCHMCPEYVPLCAPWTLPAGVPLTLWYTHGTANARLRLAVRLARRTWTASLPEFPLVEPSKKAPKIVALGHGIDLKALRPSPLPPGPGRTLLSLGRLSPVKDHALIVRAFAKVLHRTGRSDLRLRVVGGPPLPEHRAVEEELRGLLAEESLAESVELVGAVPYRRVAEEITRSHLLVSASRTGSLDKAVLEAMACARPVLTSNSAFRSELDDPRLMFREGDVDELADKLEALLTAGDGELTELGAAAARRVEERHGLEDFADRLIRALEDLGSPRR